MTDAGWVLVQVGIMLVGLAVVAWQMLDWPID